MAEEVYDLLAVSPLTALELLKKTSLALQDTANGTATKF